MVRAFLFAFVLVLSSSAPAFADTVRGRVLDPGKLPVRHAQVLVVSGGTVVAVASTSADGSFGPLTLPAGKYSVIVAAPGLRAPAREIAISAGNPATIEITLGLAAVGEAVVVSAAQVERPLSRVTDSVEIITRADLEARQIETASEALRAIPGFGLVTSGGRGALTSIFPRGGESDYTLVLVDGIALNAFGGGFDAAHLPVAGVDRIEVVRGPQSAVFGSGAIGGIVNVVTRKGGAPRFGAVAETGQQGTSRLLADTSGARGAWSWGASFERLASDGNTSFSSSINGPVSNDDYERVVGTAGIGWSDKVSRRFRADVRFGKDERGFPGPYGSDPLNLYSQIEMSRGENRPRGFSASAVLGQVRSLRHSAHLSWTDTPSEFTTAFGTSENRSRRLTGRYQADLERGVFGLSSGVEAVKERADNTFVTDAAFEMIPVNRALLGLFAEGRWDPRARVAVTAGVRLERIERGALAADFFGSRPALPDDVIWSVNPKVSAVWFLRGDRSSDASAGWTRIRGGAGTGIKPPTVFELGFTDNPSLAPERSRSADVGIEHAFPRTPLVIDATAFFNRYDDLIVSVGTGLGGASSFRTDNIANASAAGLELGVRWLGPQGLSFRASHTFLRTRVLAVDRVPGAAPAPYQVGDWLIRRPRHAYSIEGRIDRGRLQGFVALNGRGRILDVEPNLGAPAMNADGYVVASAGASFRIARQLEGYARVTNLFDRDYEDALGYPALARSASVGVRVAVGR
jgi:outer membrane cobalamin receptor